jgi:hypothetical protein
MGEPFLTKAICELWRGTQLENADFEQLTDAARLVLVCAWGDPSMKALFHWFDCAFTNAKLQGDGSDAELEKYRHVLLQARDRPGTADIVTRLYDDDAFRNELGAKYSLKGGLFHLE